MNNVELARGAEIAYSRGDQYILGAFGNKITPAFLDMKLNQPGGVGDYNSYHYNLGHIDTRKVAWDCYGLVKGQVWGNLDGGGNYVVSQDRNEYTAFAVAKDKGAIQTIPKQVGIVVYMPGHVGIVTDVSADRWQDYIVVEAQGMPYNMQRHKLAKPNHTPWTHWFRDTYIRYDNVPVPDSPESAEEGLIINPPASIPQVGDIVRITSSHWANGVKIPFFVKVQRHVVAQIIDGKALLGYPRGVCSWAKVSDLKVVGRTKPKIELKPGDMVKITGKTYTNGTVIPLTVKERLHIVSQIVGDRALLGANGGICSWVRIKDVVRL